ncbi:hypothetical protein Cgig2_025406 [Carnegiea gigantea]|uniref:RNase H type-1 domain-containing protein n=1 Tax=Carnegiea gigantea TaxID=171969 RepID=A0A9Q1K0Y1_9CARY|nr:hypothetical protein Cgig2_025406 [Carnegiea gigantea]
MPDKSLAILGARAISFVRGYRASHACETKEKTASPALWKPPESGWFKLSFDRGKNGESGRGWGFVLRSCDGDIILASVDQGSGFAGPKVEEARACLFGLRCARDARIDTLVVEGDCLPLIQKLKQKKIQDNNVGFFVRDILSVRNSFTFISWSFVKWGRGGETDSVVSIGGTMAGVFRWPVGGRRIRLKPEGPEALLRWASGGIEAKKAQSLNSEEANKARVNVVFGFRWPVVEASGVHG